MIMALKLCHVFQDLLVINSPKPRNVDNDLSDLLDHCVTIGAIQVNIYDKDEKRRFSERFKNPLWKGRLILEVNNT